MKNIDTNRIYEAIFQDYSKLYGGEPPNLRITNPSNYFYESVDESNSLPGI